MNRRFDEFARNWKAGSNAGSPKQDRRTKNPALVQLAAEGIDCSLYVRSFSERDQSVTYELVISNKTAVGISCRLYGLDTSAHTREYGMLTIGKNSAGNSFFSIPLGTGEQRRLFVEVIGDGVNLFAEALQPAVRAKTGWPRSALATFVAFSAVGLVATYFGEKPRVDGLSVPLLAAPGKITAIYAVSGSARVRYRATRLDGSLVGAEVLPAQSGEFTLNVPAESRAYSIRLTLSAGGLLGKAERTETVRVVDNPIDAFGTVIDRESDSSRAESKLRTSTTMAASPLSAALLSLPLHIVAGKNFEVGIKHPHSGLRLTFKDGLEAVVEDIDVPVTTGRIVFAAPASPTVETYSIAGSYKRGSAEKTTIQSFRIYPQ